jgi:sporulation protein YlmC with PRC-barrel domain
VTMTEAAKFTMGSDVHCADGECGALRRVVVDPVARTLTHLVVEPGHRERDGHLVPIGLVASAGPQIELSCSLAEFEALEQEDMLSWPYYGLGVGGGVGITAANGADSAAHAVQVSSYEHIPDGEVQVRRGEHVHATDGTIGRVQGLVVDPGDHRVTHVLLDEGHLWGLKQVAIPIGSVTGVEDGVQLDLTKDQVRDLPAVDLEKQE